MWKLQQLKETIPENNPPDADLVHRVMLFEENEVAEMVSALDDGWKLRQLVPFGKFPPRNSGVHDEVRQVLNPNTDGAFCQLSPSFAGYSRNVFNAFHPEFLCVVARDNRHKAFNDR